MDITSGAIAIDFIVIAYKDWVRKGKPSGDSRAKQFQKNCFILWGKLISKCIFKQWHGAADNKTAVNIAALPNGPGIFRPVPEENWAAVLDEIFSVSTIDGVDVSVALMKPLLYHCYCLEHIPGPSTHYSLEVDHIIPQTLFAESSILKSRATFQILRSCPTIIILQKAPSGSSKLKVIGFAQI